MIRATRRLFSRPLLTAGALLFTLPLVQQSLAQDGEAVEDEFILEEIIVTARKRMETLQETPVAITAMGAEALAEAGVANISDLQKQAPGLSFSGQSGKNPAIFIRGVGQRETTAALDPGVGVYINNIYISRTDSQLLDTVDTESIQILRGPQGTLFGKNNTGGAILVTTVTPHTEGFEGYAYTRVGNYGRLDGKFSANIPLNDDNLAMRVAVNSRRMDGYIENLYDGKDYADEDRIAASASVNWQATDELVLDLFLYRSIQKERGGALTCRFLNPDSPLANFRWPAPDGSEPNGVSYPDACQASEALADDEKVNFSGASVAEMTNTITALTLSWDINDLEFKSISSFSFQDDILIQDDLDGTVRPGAENGHLTLRESLSASLQNGYGVGRYTLPGDERRQQFTQEFQLIGSAFDESLSYTVGLFYAREELDNVPFTQKIGYEGISYYPENLILTTTFLGTVSDLVNETYAVFAQGTYDLTNDLQMTLGVRYTAEDREREAIVLRGSCDDLYASGEVPGDANICGAGSILLLNPTDFYLNPPGYLPIDVVESTIPLDGGDPILTPGGYTKDDGRFTKVTPTFTLAYNMPEDLLELMNFDSSLVYLTVSKGFKAGGYEMRGSEMVKFDPETVTNYELGWKWDALEHRLRFNMAAYRMDYQDLQVRVAEVINLVPLVYIANAGEATLKGLEMEITALPAPNLKLQFSANLTDASYDEFTGRWFNRETLTDEIKDRSAEPWASTPELTYSLAIMYDWNTSVGRITPRLSLYYRDEVFIGLDYLSGLENYVYKNKTPNDPSDDQILNFRKGATIDDVTLLDFRLAYADPDEVITLALYVENLTDEDWFTGGQAPVDGFGSANLNIGSPRTYGLEATYRF